YDGEELARNYVVFFDRQVKLGETSVALFSVGDGGNACGTATVIAWKKNDALENAVIGEDCGAPPASVGETHLYFVPFLRPGETAALQSWSPEEGVRTAGDLSFTPQPETDWSDFKPETTEYVIDAFDNAAIYDAAKALLGGELAEVAGGLLAGGTAELTADGTVTGDGWLAHACGVSAGCMAIDPKDKKLSFAQQGDPQLRTWPALAAWPAPLKTAMDAAIGPNRQ